MKWLQICVIFFAINHSNISKLTKLCFYIVLWLKKDFSIDIKKNYIVIYSNHSDLFRLKFYFFQIWITSLWFFFCNFKMTISSTLYAFTWSFWGKKVLQYQKEHFLITMIVEWKLCLGHMDFNFWQLTENDVLQLSQVL